MRSHRSWVYAVVIALALWICEAEARPAETGANAQAKRSARARATGSTLATVGARKVEEIDLRHAAEALASDPLRSRNPAAWRRMLLDRCVDRELLAAEAERQGFDKDPVLESRIADNEYRILLREIHQRVLVPGLIPTPQQLRDLRAGGLYRGVDLHYIILRDDASGPNRPMALRVLQSAKAGARFDSLAKQYSGHPPSMAAGGHFGWVLARDLDPASYEDVRRAKEGDVLGVYSGPFGHEIYKIGSLEEPSPDSLYTLVYNERRRGISRDYDRDLLTRYHFSLDSTQVQAVLFAAGSETPDSILASLGPDGTRPKRGARPALGILARCDGDSVTFRDMIRATPPILGATGRMRIRDVATLYQLCARAVLRGLTVRDARERGIARKPEVARELRLLRDQIRTYAMVRRHQAAVPDDAGLKPYFEAHADRYRRSRAVTAKVAVFASREGASAARHEWERTGMTGELLAAKQFRSRSGATPASLEAGWHATLTIFAGDPDPLSRELADIPAGRLAPVIDLKRGYAVAQVLSTEAARPYTFEEAAHLVRRNWVDEMENDWVVNQLERLRARTPIRIASGRLEAMKWARPAVSEGGVP